MSTLFSEAIKLKDGVLYNLEYHQERVNRTLYQFYGTTIDLSSIKAMIPDDKTSGLYKCRLIYGRDIHTVEFIPYFFRQITKVCFVKGNDIEYGYKCVDRSRLNELLETSGCDEIVIVKNGRITDSSAANLVFRSSSGLYTPEVPLLAGTKRQYLLDKGVIRTGEIRLDDISKYDRMFFINAMIDLEDDISINV